MAGASRIIFLYPLLSGRGARQGNPSSWAMVGEARFPGGQAFSGAAGRVGTGAHSARTEPAFSRAHGRSLGSRPKVSLRPERKAGVAAGRALSRRGSGRYPARRASRLFFSVPAGKGAAGAQAGSARAAGAFSASLLLRKARAAARGRAKGRGRMSVFRQSAARGKTAFFRARGGPLRLDEWAYLSYANFFTARRMRVFRRALPE